MSYGAILTRHDQLFLETEHAAQPLNGGWCVALAQAGDYGGLGVFRNSWHGCSPKSRVKTLASKRAGDRQLRAMTIGLAHELEKLAVPGFRRRSIACKLRRAGGAEQASGSAPFSK